MFTPSQPILTSLPVKNVLFNYLPAIPHLATHIERLHVSGASLCGVLQQPLHSAVLQGAAQAGTPGHGESAQRNEGQHVS